MRIPSTSVSDYIRQIPEERKSAFNALMDVFRANLPEGFSEGLGYGMPAS